MHRFLRGTVLLRVGAVVLPVQTPEVNYLNFRPERKKQTLNLYPPLPSQPLGPRATQHVLCSAHLMYSS